MNLYLELVAAIICGIFYPYFSKLDRVKEWLLKASKIDGGKGIKKIVLEAGMQSNFAILIKLLQVSVIIYSFYDNWKHGIFVLLAFAFTYVIVERLNIFPNRLGHYLMICLKSAGKVALIKAKGSSTSLHLVYDSDLEFVRLATKVYKDLPVDVPSSHFIKNMEEGNLLKLKEVAQTTTSF